MPAREPPEPTGLEADHRQWPPPDRPWVGRMTWTNLLFAHWRLPEEVLRAAVPRELELETFDGSGWIGVIPFNMVDVSARGFPPVPGLSQCLELNVRTYVRHRGRAGVYFFSLDAQRLLYVLGARTFYRLPYYFAEMAIEVQASERVRYACRRRSGGAAFKGWYEPLGDPYLSRPGTLDHWLTERYCLYTLASEGRVLIGDIHHAPWPLQAARAEIAANTMMAPLGIALPSDPPHLRYARSLKVLVWWPASDAAR